MFLPIFLHLALLVRDLPQFLPIPPFARSLVSFAVSFVWFLGPPSSPT